MQVQHYERVPQNPVDMPGAQGCAIRWLVGPDQGAPHFAMRQFEVSVGGHTPQHTHPYEHEVFVLEGRGVALAGDAEHSLQGGDVVYVAPNEVHQFRNTGDTPFKFLCLVPNVALGKQVAVAPECGS